MKEKEFDAVLVKDKSGSILGFVQISDLEQVEDDLHGDYREIKLEYILRPSIGFKKSLRELNDRFSTS